jgi:hypothetical protein
MIYMFLAIGNKGTFNDPKDMLVPDVACFTHDLPLHIRHLSFGIPDVFTIVSIVPGAIDFLAWNWT